MREFIVKEYQTFPYKGAMHEMPELIRCKDCKHWDGVDTCDVIDAPVWDDDFCSLAEREEE